MTNAFRLLKEYISLLMEDKSKNPKKPKDPNEIRGQMLSQLAEYAVAAGLGNSEYSNFEQAVEKLNLPFQVELSEMSSDKIDVIVSIYKKCIDLASSAAKPTSGLAMPRGEVNPQNEGTVTAPVDIIITDENKTKHEIHVKFNDAERLIGLQGGSTTLTAELLSGDVNKTWPSAVQYKYYRNQFAKKLLKMEQDPADKSSYQTLYDKGEHRTMITNKEVRKLFLDYLRDEGLPNMILDEVKAFFLRSQDRKVYFFKYKTKPNPAKFDKDNIVSLSVSMLKANPNNFGIVENFAPEIDDDIELTSVQAAQKQHALSTRLYTITYDGEPVFVIEARSGSHPMQLKLFSTKTKMENIYDEVELNIGSA
jgi:hypothetical protein